MDEVRILFNTNNTLGIKIYIKTNFLIPLKNFPTANKSLRYSRF